MLHSSSRTATSWHPRERVPSRDDSIIKAPESVGIDVSQSARDLHLLPEGHSFTIRADHGAVQWLLDKLDFPKAPLVVLEATGGFERQLVAKLIDAETLAIFAQRLRPRPTRKELEKRRELDALVTRRWPSVALWSLEKMRRHQATFKAVSRSIEKVLNVFDHQVALLDKAIARRVEADDDWRAKHDLIESVPGVGPTTNAMLVAEMPELGRLNRQEIAALAGLAPFNHVSGRSRGQKADSWRPQRFADHAVHGGARCAALEYEIAELRRTSEMGRQTVPGRHHSPHAKTAHDPQYAGHPQREAVELAALGSTEMGNPYSSVMP